MNILKAILQMWAQGYSIPGIAQALNIDNDTVNKGLWRHFAGRDIAE